MGVSFDVAELSHELATLRSHPHVSKVAVVLPLASGMRNVAYEVLAEGPPFDADALGLASHEVFLSDAEAIFVFGLADGPETLEKILADEEFWTVVSSWERIAGGRPRLATVAFDWSAE
jgi:hypothetical protein